MQTKSLKRLCLLAIALLSTGLNAGEDATPAEPGLRVGERAPNFTLKDQNEKEVSLESLLKKGPVALVFYRSASWCLYCEIQLIKLQRNLKQIEASGGQLIGISYDSTDILKRFADRKDITIQLLSDAGSKTIDAYNVRDKNAVPEKQGVAVHATIVVDQAGIVRSKMIDIIYDERSDINKLAKALKAARTSDGGTK